jgi:hypothetical protein
MKYPKKRVIFYIDGFNLYYGALRNQPYRWVNLEALCSCYLKSGFELVGVKYFTAKLKDRPENPGQSERQRQYLRALKTLPIVSIYYGQFLVRTAIRQLEKLPGKHRKGDIGLRSVWIHEEKGSDVNLATQLIADGFRARYDLAVVISNDSDLKMPVDFVRSERPKEELRALAAPDPRRVVLLPPQAGKASALSTATRAPGRGGHDSLPRWLVHPPEVARAARGRLCISGHR